MHCTTRWFGVGSSKSSTCWFALSSRVAQHRFERAALDHEQAAGGAHDRGRAARAAVQDRHLAEELAGG